MELSKVSEAHSEDLAVRLRAYLDTLHPSLAPMARDLLGLDRDRERTANGIRLQIRAAWIAELFGISDVEVVGRAEMATRLAATHTILQDRRIDGEFANPAVHNASDAVGSLLLADSLAVFSAIAQSRNFWSDVHASLDELANAYAQEARRTDELARLAACGNLDDIRESAAGLCATVQILVSAMACRSGQPGLKATVNRAIRRALVGMQIRDDLSDWRADDARGKASYVLLRIADMHTLTSPGQYPPEDLADALYLRGGLERLIVESNGYLREALEIVAPYPHQLFREYLDSIIRDNDAILDQTTQLKRAFLAREGASVHD